MGSQIKSVLKNALSNLFIFLFICAGTIGVISSFTLFLGMGLGDIVYGPNPITYLLGIASSILFSVYTLVIIRAIRIKQVVLKNILMKYGSIIFLLVLALIIFHFTNLEFFICYIIASSEVLIIYNLSLFDKYIKKLSIKIEVLYISGAGLNIIYVFICYWIVKLAYGLN